MSPDAALSPRRATHFSLLRQRKVSKKKATLLSASLRFAAGNLRCSVQSGSRANSLRSNKHEPYSVWTSAPRRIQKDFAGTGSDSGSGGSDINATVFIAACAHSAWARGQKYLQERRAAWFSGSDHNFAAKRSGVPVGQAEGSGNLCSDPENTRSRIACCDTRSG